MNIEMTFRVKVNSLTHADLFEKLSPYPSGVRAELARLALSEYLDKHTAIPASDDVCSYEDLTSMMD